MTIDGAYEDLTRPYRSRNAILERIAAALGTPVADFFAADHSRPIAASPDFVAAGEGSALMKAFGAITDPEARRLCLAYVQAIAQATS